MRHLLSVMCVLCLLMLPVSAQENAPSVEIAGPLVVIGGNNVSIQNSSTLQLEDSERPILAEDYTATWCENCVYAENSLNEVAENNNVIQFHFHPEIDGQDPFGTAEGDQWWERRYGERRAPTIVFDGKWIHLGSTAKIGDTLTDDYLTSVSSKFEMMGELQYSWTPNGSGGEVSWGVNEDNELLEEGYSFSFHLFIIEYIAYFPDGSNGMENYSHIVSQITDLGTDLQGKETITLPQAYDEDDLHAYLVMELVLPAEEQVAEPKTADSQSISVIYAAIGGAVVILILLILILRKKRGGNMPVQSNWPPENMVQQPVVQQQPIGQQSQVNQFQQMP